MKYSTRLTLHSLHARAYRIFFSFLIITALCPLVLPANNGTDGMAGKVTVTVSGSLSGCKPPLVNIPPCPATGMIWYVDAAAAPGGTGSSWACAFQNLQDAIDAASNGHEIWVKAGTYKPTKDPFGNASPTNPRDKTFYLKNGVAIYGGFDGSETLRSERDWAANVTTLSGDLGTSGDNSDNAYHVVISVNDVGTTVMDGFTVSGGNADRPASITVEGQPITGKNGGGRYTSGGSTPLTNCIFSGNSALTNGGGVFITSAGVATTITNCTFSSNSADANGGGLFNHTSSTILTHCTFSGNAASGGGGGVYNNSISPAPQLNNCTFSSNSANNGGGVYNSSPSGVLSGCIFSGNSATNNGGGMFIVSSSPAITNCSFSGNMTSDEGGGMFISASSPAITNCTFSGNSAAFGGGAYNSSSSPTLTNCTFSGNKSNSNGGGIYNISSSNPTLANCIIWNNQEASVTGSADASITNDGTSTPVIIYSLIQNHNPAGTGNLNGIPNAAESNYPNFASPLDPATAPSTAGNFSLAICSPVANVGNNAGVTATDLAGNPRIFNVTVDLGAYERQTGAPDHDFIEDFDGIPGPTAGGKGTFVFPVGWTLVNVDNRTPANPINYVNDAWERIADPANETDSVAISNSWYNPTGQADDWMWTPLIGVVSSTSTLSWNAIAFDPAYLDGYEVRVMMAASGPPNGAPGNLGNMVSSSALLFSIAEENSAWTPRTVSLSAYAGQSVYIGFRNNTNNKFTLAIDDVAVSSLYTATPEVCNGIDDNCDGMVDEGNVCCPATGTVWYVDALAAPGGTGTSWSCAFQQVQDAIDAASSGHEIWVKAGTYKPTKDPSGNASPTDPRDKTFHLKDGVAVYGGFNGTETMRSQRNWTANMTALSGDIGVENDNSDNSYHVVLSVNDGNTTVLDGFTVTGGNANNLSNLFVEPFSINRNFGGGMLNRQSATVVNYCTFSNNTASNSGGGVYNKGGSPSFSACIFSGNSADGGGGVFNMEATPTFTNCSFLNNIGSGNGGGMQNQTSTNVTVSSCIFQGNSCAGSGGGFGIAVGSTNATLTNCLFTGNTADGQGGGIYNSNTAMTLTNCTISGNRSNSSGGGVRIEGGVGPIVTNCLIWNNRTGSNTGSATANLVITPTPIISYSLIQNHNPSGTGNLNGTANAAISNYPNFASPLDPAAAPSTAGDFHLTNCSPVLNRGTNTAPATDLFGNARPFGTTVDLGVHELQQAPENVPPSITCPPNTTVAVNSSCQFSMTNFSSSVVVSDNCTASGNISTIQNPSVGTMFSVVVQPIMFTATDAAGNSSTCSFHLMIRDETVPNITCPANTTVAANAACQFSMTDFAGSATASDNCTSFGPVSKTQNPIVGTMLPLGTQTVTLRAADVFGLSSTCTFALTVTDQTMPDITCPANTTVTATGGAYTLADFASAATASDNCTNNPAKTQLPTVGTSLGLGNQTITLKATDGAGLTSACTFTVTVETGCPASGAIWYVDGTAAPGGNGASWTCAFQNVQDAIDAASSGHEIWVKAGTYKPTKDPFGNAAPADPRDKTFYLKNGVKIYGGFDGTETMRSERDWAANVTTFSGDIGAAGVNTDNCYHVVLAVNSQNTTELDGFTLSHGKADGTGFITVSARTLNRNTGGGMFNGVAAPNVANCIFSNNTAGNGAGMANENAAPTLTNCTFSGNSTTFGGGGMYNNISSNPTLANCIFSNNSAEYGGGIFSASTTLMATGCAFLNNTANDNGGGVSNNSVNTPFVFTNCIFSGNSASRGGGMYNSNAAPTLTNCLLTGNLANNGGGMYNATGWPILTNCTISGNTSMGTEGGGLANLYGSNPTLTNCVIWNNRNNGVTGSALASMSTNTGSSVNIQYSLIQNHNPSGTGNLNGIPNAAETNYPDFVTPLDPAEAPSANGDFHIGVCSPVLNKGKNTGAPLDDLFGNARPFGSTVDMGVHEIQSAPTPTVAICQNTTVNLDGTGSATLSTSALDNSSTGCLPLGFSASQTSFNCANLGANTVTLTVSGNNGNTATCTATVTVRDVTPPTANCQNITVNLSGNSASIVAAQINNNSTDNCSIVNLGGVSPSSLTCANLGTNTVTLTVGDGSGNTATCTATVTARASEINLQGNNMDIIDGDDMPSTADHTDFGQTTGASVTRTFTVQNTDPNAPLSVTGISLSGLNANQFSVGPLMPESPVPPNGSATFTVTYAPNTTGVHDATITVTNGDCSEGLYDFAVRGELSCSAPSFTTCPIATVQLSTSANGCSAIGTYGISASGQPAPSFTYAFVGATTGSGSGTGSASSFNKGITAVTVTASNPCGAPTCTFSVQVTDDVLPTIVCPNSITTTATTGQCSAAVNYTVSGSDNCTGWSLLRTNGLQSGALFPVGTTTVSWKNTDGAGNSTTCSFNVMVTDGQLPTIACPANITANATAGSCGATVNYASPVAADNCTSVVVSHVSGGISGSSFNKGVNTIEWKATDGANNTRTCSFTITVNDTQAPIITCPANLTANTAAGTCAATVTFNNATATDNCTPPPTVVQTGGGASGSSFPKGLNTISFKATDGVGLTKTCTFRITVVDNVLPTITCPSNMVKNTDNNLCTSVTNYSVTGADNCTSVSVMRLSGLTSGSAFPRGVNTVTWRATDLAGNSTLCSFTVTVNDTQQPGITCPASISTNTTTGQCSKVVNYTTPTYSDNCAGGGISLFSGLASGSVFPTGTSTVIWRAFDNSANSADCAFTITVTDNQQPLVTCPPSATVSGSGSPCGYPSAQLSTPSATDNCAVTSLASNAPLSLPAGATLITWTAKDAANNQKICAYTVTVNCGASAGARDEVGSMKGEERYEVGGMKNEARTSLNPSSLILHTSSLTLFPNPSSGVFVLSFSEALAQGGQVVIHDALGRQVWVRNLDAGIAQVMIDLTSGTLEDGVYQIGLRTEEGVVTKSLVLARR